MTLLDEMKNTPGWKKYSFSREISKYSFRKWHG